MSKHITSYNYTISIDDNGIPYVYVPLFDLFEAAEDFMNEAVDDHVIQEHKNAVRKFIDTLIHITSPDYARD